jgi:hypothetical protein
MKSSVRTLATTLLTSMFVALLAVASARADVVMDWNAKADAIAAEKRIGPTPHARVLTILHVSMFEAVNAIERRYAPYRLNLSADRATSKEAAAASAGYGVLLSFYPDKKADLDAILAAALSGVAEGDAKQNGIRLGYEAAAGIMALRASDGSDVAESYRPHTSPGLYVPTVVPVNSTSGAVTPWVMTSGAQFRPAAPPALTSETWTRDYNEIREIGGLASTRRTAEQTTMGRFWFLTGPRTYNPLVHQAAKAKNMDLVDSARLFALVLMAGADAGTAVFDAKYAYNLWRPVTAIRNADQTGNSATPREASWQPLGETPMHPEYPCAHCITSQAVSTVLQAVVGESIGEMTLTSPTAPGVTRKWTRFQDYNDEVSNARIYAGFHYRFSTDVGKDMGKKIGELTIATQLRGATATAEPRR